MTTPVCVQQRIRQLDRQGLSHREISRKLGVSRTTVVKYANHGDYSPKPLGSGHAGRSLVDAGYSAVVDGWLTADLRMPVKQRHTATRVYERLVAECGFTGSYSSVQRWVKRWRREHRMESDGFAELEWAPGSAQVDFGQARAVIAGVERVVHFLVVSFPYSNMRWVVALPGETSECVCQGLLWIFERMGMAPRVVVFDNATGVGHRRPDGTVTQTRLFSLFCAHYGFEPRFCNPYSGHEKGSVENAVGFVRRNLMVPMPSAESFQTLTRVWLDACERIAGSDHYRHDVPVIELFEAEKDHMLPLPGVRFDPCDWRSVKTDKTGAATIDANRYLAGPKWRSMRLQAGVRVFEIELRGPDGETITTLERIWGHSAKTQVGSGEPARDHRAKAPHMGRKPDQERFPRNRASPARPHGRTHALQSARRHPSRCRRLRVRCHGQSGGNRHQRGTDRRPRGDRHMCQTHPRGCGNRRRAGFEALRQIHEGGRMSQQKPRQRGGRVLDKATPEQVMGLARNLPLTHSVLEKALEDATPGQLGFLANLFEKENASRAESKRRRLLKQAGFPQSKTLEGYDWSMASFPADWGREQLESLEFVDRAEDLVLYGDVGCGKTHLAIAIGMLACQRMIPVRFFTASSLVMRLRKAKDDNRLDAELKSIGRAGLVIIDELGYLPIDIDGARLLFQVIADSYETRSVIFTSNLEFSRWGDVFGDGDMAAAVIDRIVHHGRILRFHGESYRNKHSLMK